jgi:hypothetical protein
MMSPYVITVIRMKKRQTLEQPSRTIWKLRREYFGNECIRWFVIELLLFAVLVAISVWSMIPAIGALRLL